ncbi:MAG: alpha/beta hydrolase [Bacteroidetes bacterium]|nr:alpha/beta hydrolase [Bacteroidota bacterium]
MKSLFKSIDGKKSILELYDQKLDSLHTPYEYLTVETSFGTTNIIACGDEKHPPILLFHGANGCAPIALETYPKLYQKFRVYAVDVLAQPNKSAETRLSMKDTSYGQWVHELITKLDLESVTMAGFSFGGLVILKALEYDESKIAEVFLSAPAYIVNGNPFKALFKVFLPMKRYMTTKNPKFVEQFLAELFTDRDEFAIQFLSKVFLEFEMDFTPVPVIDSKKANRITTPINIFAAQHDILFPGKKMLKRAQKIFPSLRSGQLLMDSKHVQSKTQNRMIEEIIMKGSVVNKTC